MHSWYAVGDPLLRVRAEFSTVAHTSVPSCRVSLRYSESTVRPTLPCWGAWLGLSILDTICTHNWRRTYAVYIRIFGINSSTDISVFGSLVRVLLPLTTLLDTKLADSYFEDQITRFYFGHQIITSNPWRVFQINSLIDWDFIGSLASSSLLFWTPNYFPALGMYIVHPQHDNRVKEKRTGVDIYI